MTIAKGGGPPLEEELDEEGLVLLGPAPAPLAAAAGGLAAPPLPEAVAPEAAPAEANGALDRPDDASAKRASLCAGVSLAGAVAQPISANGASSAANAVSEASVCVGEGGPAWRLIVQRVDIGRMALTHARDGLAGPLLIKGGVRAALPSATRAGAHGCGTMGLPHDDLGHPRPI